MIDLINRVLSSIKTGFKFKVSRFKNKLKEHWKKLLLIALLIYSFFNWNGFSKVLNNVGSAISSIFRYLLWPLRWIICLLLLGLVLLKKYKQIWNWIKDKFRGGWKRFSKVFLSLALLSSFIAIGFKHMFLINVFNFLKDALNVSFWSFQKTLLGLSTALTAFNSNNVNFESFGNVLSQLQKLSEYPKQYQLQYMPQIKQEVKKLLNSVEIKLQETEQQLKDISPNAYYAYRDLLKDIDNIHKVKKVVEDLSPVKCMVKMRKSTLGAYHYIELTDEYIKDLPKKECLEAGAIVVDMEQVKSWYSYSYTGLSYGYWVPLKYDYHSLKDNWNCGVSQVGTLCRENKKLGSATSIKETFKETLKILSYWVTALIGTKMLIIAIPQIWTWGTIIPKIILPSLGMALA